MSLFIGANHVFRSVAHHEIDGYAGHIVEDHLTGMNIYKKNWKSVYVPKVLAVGEGPSTWDTYFNQQMRWAYGLFHILFNHSPKIYPKLKIRHLLNYVVLQQYYMYGILQFVAVLLLSLYFIFGINAAHMDLIPMVTMYTMLLGIQLLISTWLQRFFIDPKTESGLHIRAKLLNIAVWPIYLLAFISVIVGKKITYKVTSKGEKLYTPPSISLFFPHLLLGMLTALSLIVSIITNHHAIHLVFFALIHTVVMIGLFMGVVIENLVLKIRGIKSKIPRFVLPTFPLLSPAARN